MKKKQTFNTQFWNKININVTFIPGSPMKPGNPTLPYSEQKT